MAKLPRTTIKDIANEINLSPSTISRILHNKPGYSKDTQQLVKETAHKLGYLRNNAAVDLVKQQSNVIAVIVSNTKSNFSEEIIAAIENKARENDLEVFIIHADNHDADSQKYAIESVIGRSMRAIVLVSLELNDEVVELLEEANIPNVCLSMTTPSEKLHYITSDNFKMGYNATQLLIDKGHTNIGIIGIPNHGATMKRIKGFKQCMSDNRFNIKKYWIFNGQSTYEDGILGWQHIKKFNEVSAVICASDLTAIGFMNSAMADNISVPEQMNIISFDGTYLVDIVQPKITSITQSFYEIGLAGFNYLFNQTDNNLTYVPFTIDERNSTSHLNQTD